MLAVTELYENEISQYDTIHHWLQHTLELPDWYGHNLDALWDCLSGWISLPAEIHWIAAGNHLADDQSQAEDQESTQKLATQIDACISLFEEAAEEIEGFTFKYISSDVF